MIYKINFKNNCLEVTNFGANILSCKINDQNILFMSKKAKFDNETPIRGGVPLVFPVFGNSNTLPKHGFLRNNKWEFVKSWENEHESCIIFKFTKNSNNFNYDYDLFYQIKLNINSLFTSLDITNKSNKTMPFNMLYHNYFNINIDNFNCNSFNNKKYLNQLSNKFEYDYNLVKINEEIDRIYDNISKIDFNNITLESNANFMVLWNPYIEKSKSLNDFEDNEYKNMICIEPGLKFELQSNETFNFWQNILVR
jgi:D-hexose-6-phosphate mutarotase